MMKKSWEILDVCKKKKNIAEDDKAIEIVKVWDIFFPLIPEMEFGRRYLLE